MRRARKRTYQPFRPLQNRKPSAGPFKNNTRPLRPWGAVSCERLSQSSGGSLRRGPPDSHLCGTKGMGGGCSRNGLFRSGGMDAAGPKPAVSGARDGVANVSGGNMPLPCPEKDLRLLENEGRPGFPDATYREGAVISGGWGWGMPWPRREAAGNREGADFPRPQPLEITSPGGPERKESAAAPNGSPGEREGIWVFPPGEERVPEPGNGGIRYDRDY